MNFRIGHGYDVHRLTEGRKLILGGVEIQFEKGLLGHSDADVLTHAIMDSFLGALALGDIGHYFPDTDDRFLGVSSLFLASEVLEVVKQNGYRIGNVDATILAQAPKLSPFIPQIRKKLAAVFQIQENQISIKATTEEGLGFTGSGEGIAAHAVCLLLAD